eukprot:jgi/Galph1/3607/GphlegSOOS_G2244.1
MFGQWCSCIFSTSRDLEISTENLVGRFEGWGTSLAWFAHVLGNEPQEQKERIATLLFNQETGLGLNAVRYNIGGGENPSIARNTLEYRARIPGLYSSSSEINSLNIERDSGQLWFLLAAVERGANLVEVFSNSPPYFMTESGSVTGARGRCQNNLREECVDMFCEYLCKSTLLLQNAMKLSVVSIEPFNEPLSCWWTYGGRQEGCYFDRQLQEKTIDSLYHSLKRHELTCEIVAPDTYSTEETTKLVSEYSNETMKKLDRINTHTYSGRDRKQLFRVCNQRKKPIWVSEYGDNDGSGILLAQTILNDLKQLNPRAWVYWQAVDDSSAPDWGLLVRNLNQPDNNDPLLINKKFYIMWQFTKFIRPGFYQIFVEDNNTVVFQSPEKDKLVIVHLHTNSSSFSIKFRDLSLPVQIDMYRTSHTENAEHILSEKNWPSETFKWTSVRHALTTVTLSTNQQ